MYFQHATDAQHPHVKQERTTLPRRGGVTWWQLRDQRTAACVSDSTCTALRPKLASPVIENDTRTTSQQRRQTTESPKGNGREGGRDSNSRRTRKVGDERRQKSGRASDGSTASRHVSIEGLPSDGDCIEIDDETTTGRVDIVGRGLVDCRSNDSQSDEEHPDQAKLSWLILGSKP